MEFGWIERLIRMLRLVYGGVVFIQLNCHGAIPFYSRYFHRRS